MRVENKTLYDELYDMMNKLKIYIDSDINSKLVRSTNFVDDVKLLLDKHKEYLQNKRIFVFTE